MVRIHGRPVWYELASAPGRRDAAEDFYAALFGWKIEDAGMAGFDYRLASRDGNMVAGMMPMPDDAPDMPPFWMVYFGVDDADRATQAATGAGARVHRPPADIPGTGRFALLADPQGAAFGILDPLPMQDEGHGHAFDPEKSGHCHWQELMTGDPDAALRFYGELFGWEKSTAIPMGAMGTYQLFAHDGADIGGMQGQGDAPFPIWLPYFGHDGIEEAIAMIRELGGTVLHGPQEVPDGAFIAIAQDVQGAHFAVAGPRTRRA
ncbi:VOC family protein [Paracoccus stylophorae]|uniref:VOC family protein n=1 Tax=Paracoccus stylophorae TaxID=659350 RepID=A0ABY7SVR7_9RHOB|nr:VOC family protein [Paracoccus stylophorae]WCR10568.1 VOC family protein [Paracoccus stylophorae]